MIVKHAYTVIAVKDVKVAKLVQIRNPWGKTEWNGDWGDKSNLWTPTLKEECNFVDANDGTFWMSWDDFV